MKKRYWAVYVGFFLCISAPNLSFSQNNQATAEDSNQSSAEPQITQETILPVQNHSLKQWVGTIKPAAGPMEVDSRRTTQQVPYWQQKVNRSQLK
nr:hypothetical protein [Desulfobulbaceae bacterium]